MKRFLLTALSGLFLAPSGFAIVDTNNNGLSDLWEKAQNNGELFPETFDPQADPDADGWTNAQEAAAGTNPFDPNPPDGLIRPEIALIPAVMGEPDEDGVPIIITPEAITIAWPTLVGKQYTLLFSPDLTQGSWIPVGVPFIGTGDDPPFAFEAGDSDKRFWRVAAEDIDQDSDGLTNHEEFLARTNPTLTDTDGDTLSDHAEIIAGTDPNHADADYDGMEDRWETIHGLDPTDMDDGYSDPDGDGIQNQFEYVLGFNPTVANAAELTADRDSDGMPDFWEAQTGSFQWSSVTQQYNFQRMLDWENPADAAQDSDSDLLTNAQEFLHGTDPLNSDTDNDNLLDGWEIANGLAPRVYNSVTDPDGDGLTNSQEQRLSLAPLDNDTDDDGTSDGEEDPDSDGLANLTEFNTHHTNPLKTDTDADGLADGAEVNTHFTNPTKHDTDGDGMPDGWEIQHNLNAKDATGLNGATGDPDNDGLDNFHEWLNGSDPYDADSDDDGANDLAEVNQGSDPFDPSDGGNPPMDEIQEVNFKVYGDYASWRMEIRGDGPRDKQTRFVVSPAVGVPKTGTIKLRRNNKYKVTLHHTGSKENQEETWYCWEARVDDKPEQQTFPDYKPERITDAAMFFTIGDGHWIVDNRDGLFSSHNHRTEQRGGNATSGLEATLIPVDLISDLNNDGQITAADNPLRDAAIASGATDEIKDKGTEFIFHNDTLSNGIWDKEDTDPARPATEKDDDDAEEITVKVGITEGEVWLDHPAIAGLSFYKTRECNAADKVNLSPSSKFTVSASNPFPDKLFMRADGTLAYPPADPQFAGVLVLKIKVGTNDQEIEAVKMKLTVVKQLGANKYFHTVRDYIFENNTKTFTQEKAYGASTKYRIVGMREESTFMSGLDTYDHGADAPRLRGIDEVKANYTSDVIINGNQCFFHDDRNPYIAGLTAQMTNRCEGRLCVARNILRPPSNDTHNPNLGGPGARYVCYTSGEPQIINNQVTVPSEFNFATGQIPEAVPATPDYGIGGLAAKYDRQELQDSENQAIGRGPAIEQGKGIIFTATTYVGNPGNAIDFAADARKSGVKPLSGGDGSQWELLFLDGSSSVGLILTNPQGVQKTVIKGGKHTGAPYYCINTYLLFECQKVRN